MPSSLARYSLAAACVTRVLPTAGQTGDPPGDTVGVMAKRGIVSNVVTTAGGRRAWVEMDAAQHFTVRCEGCDLSEYRAGLAPALGLLVDHKGACTRR